MERSLLAIVSLMVFQIFKALYINCELGSRVIRKASFLFDSKYKEYKDIGILYLKDEVSLWVLFSRACSAVTYISYTTLVKSA